MDFETFKEITERGKFTLIGKRNLKEGDIYLAERTQTHEDYPIAYWETMWAISRGTVDVAQFVNNDKVATVNGIQRRITQEERIADAIEGAEQWIADNLEVGRYGDKMKPVNGTVFLSSRD